MVASWLLGRNFSRDPWGLSRDSRREVNSCRVFNLFVASLGRGPKISLKFAADFTELNFMTALTDIPTVAHAIQQAVAPVFLLTGVGSILSVLTNRLGRAIDRYRRLNEQLEAITQAQRAEMRTLSMRARWIYGAISLCTVSALCVCLSIASLFVGVEMVIDLSETVATLFVVAMLALVLGLLCFLREIALAIGVIGFRVKI